jgi:hypothetical protein
MSKTAKLLMATLIVGLQVVACSSSRQEQMRPIGPDVKASFVFYFKKDVTQAQISAFTKEVLSRPHPEGRGEYQAPGVQSTLLVSVPGHEGYAITFHANATPEQRERLMAEVKASPLVYKVLEGVAPDDVKKID